MNIIQLEESSEPDYDVKMLKLNTEPIFIHDQNDGWTTVGDLSSLVGSTKRSSFVFIKFTKTFILANNSKLHFIQHPIRKAFNLQVNYRYLQVKVIAMKAILILHVQKTLPF